MYATLYGLHGLGLFLLHMSMQVPVAQLANVRGGVWESPMIGNKCFIIVSNGRSRYGVMSRLWMSSPQIAIGNQTSSGVWHEVLRNLREPFPPICPTDLRGRDAGYFLTWTRAVDRSIFADISHSWSVSLSDSASGESRLEAQTIHGRAEAVCKVLRMYSVGKVTYNRRSSNWTIVVMISLRMSRALKEGGKRIGRMFCATFFKISKTQHIKYSNFLQCMFRDKSLRTDSLSLSPIRSARTIRPLDLEMRLTGLTKPICVIPWTSAYIDLCCTCTYIQLRSQLC